MWAISREFHNEADKDKCVFFAAERNERDLFRQILIGRKERRIIGQRIGVLIFSPVEGEKPKGFLAILEEPRESMRRGGGEKDQSDHAFHYMAVGEGTLT